MSARIYQPAKSAMQSGEARTRNWILEYAPVKPRKLDPLMGWTSSGDPKSQIRLKFATKEQALAYVKARDIACTVSKPHKRARKPKAYADNFKTNRLIRWTH